MSAVAEPLIDYLRQLERQGQTHVHLDDRARKILREFYMRVKSGGQKSQAAPAPQNVRKEETPSIYLSAVPAQATTQAAVATTEVLSNSLDGIKSQILADAALKGLGSLREKLVFSEGDESADVMLVGEAPSYYDELKGAPFSGPVGKKMEEILKAMRIAREEVYMTNLVKYRPAMANQTTNTRKPNPDEINASMRYLMVEISIVKPKVVIVLGKTAAKALIGTEVPVKNMLGQFHKVAGVPVRATYHPSYLLHQEITPEKRAVWADMLDVMELLGMPISEQQRGYFKKK